MTSTTTLADVQKRAEAVSKTRDNLSGLFKTLQEGIDVVRNSHLPEIKLVARKLAKQHNELQDLIRANPELFVKPRTHIVDGLKFGMQKKVGTLSWEDDAKLCARIDNLVSAEALTEEQRDMLINVTEKPVSKALEKLDGKLLKRLGVTLSSDVDEPLIKSVDSEIEKAVNAVIKDATKDANAEVQP
jgi:hypothetical protein